jgi:hypothetical protein
MMIDIFFRLRRLIWLLTGLAAVLSVGALLTPAGQAAPLVYLRLNQVGYLPTEPKVAFALTNQNLNGQTFQVVTTVGASAVFTGAVGADQGGPTGGNFSHLYQLDFSSLTGSGVYRLRLGGDTSPAFTIGTDAYAGVLSPTLHFFRVQRCGQTNPTEHGPCHLTDGVVASGALSGTHVNVDGGWHDAGDYLKFVTTSSFAAVLLLQAYQRHPQAFADADNNLTPDVLDEARLGLDWLLKMWDPANQVLYYQAGDYLDHNRGWRMPEGDDAAYPVRPVWPCEPGKGANVAGKTAAALALAATLWNDPARSYYNPTLATTYLTAAQKIYAYGKARPAAQPSTSDPVGNFIFYDESRWQDKMALAAAELYRATGSQTYLTDARAYANAAGNGWTFDWGEMSALAHYELARLDASYLPTATTFLEADLSNYQSQADTARFGVAVSPLYWGSAEAMVGAALTALWYEDLTGDTTYRAMAQAQRDYLLGGNPWGVTFVNSVGSVWPHHPHHQVADLSGAELVGFWDEGPVPREVFTEQGITLSGPDIYALFQSNEAVFHDDVEDYVTNEPTISMNAVGLALTSWYAPALALVNSPNKIYLPLIVKLA